MEITRTDPDNSIIHHEPRQATLREAFKNQEERSKEEEALKLKVANAEVKWASIVLSHGLPTSFFDCSSKLFKQMFPDSEIAQKMSESSFKGKYVGIQAHKDLKEELCEKLRKNKFSLNIDESQVNKTCQLDVNVSGYDSESETWFKENLTTISLEKGTKAEAIKDALLNELRSENVPTENCLFIQTDGCSTMIGSLNGFHVKIREEIPTLPNLDLGGCGSHDCSNVLKNAVKKLKNPILKVYHALPSYLSSQSLHRFQKYQEFCQEHGLDPRNPPKMIDVRFRVITGLAEWMLKDDEAIYGFLKENLTKEKLLRGKADEMEGTETQRLLTEHYLENYVEVKLTNLFIVEVSDTLMKFLNTFEKEESKLHVRLEKIVKLILSFSSRFMKNGGAPVGETIKAQTFLDIDTTDESLYLPASEIELGESVDKYLKEIGLSQTSPELSTWLEGIQDFFSEAFSKLIKYFTPSLKSEFLQCCQVLSPQACKNETTQSLSEKWGKLAAFFPHVIAPTKIPSLKLEAKQLKMEPVRRNESLEAFYKKLIQRVDDDGEKMYPEIGRLTKGILTIYNSSSCVERDFSLQVIFSLSIGRYE